VSVPSGRAAAWSATGAGAVGLAVLASCGAPKPAVRPGPGGSADAQTWPADDRSLCQVFVHWRNNPKLEVSETVGPGSFRPNVRRVYKVIGERDDRHSVLICREIDTNLDGIKDVVRTFNEKGEPLHEEADTNFDGRIDDWVNFADGRIVEEDMDTTFARGRPNVWKFYVNGEISRIRRNTHCPSGKADTWEIYFKSRLERVGSDSSCDGHVSRWDRDAQLMAQEEAVQSSVEVADGGAAASLGASAGSEGDAGSAAESGDAGALSKEAATRPKRRK
jgi:hypothetical protein